MPRLTTHLLPALFFGVVLLGAGGVALADAEVMLLPDGSTRLTVDADVCRKIGQSAAYHGAPGVEYEPGVDVRGAPVVPADIGGGYGVGIPKEITIPITVDLDGDWRDNATAGTLTAETLLGVVTIRDGMAFWNGRAINAPRAGGPA